MEGKFKQTSTKILRCKIGMKKMKIAVPVKVCKTVPKVVERCTDAVRLIKEMFEKEVCSLHPKQVCIKSKKKRKYQKHNKYANKVFSNYL